MALACRWRSRPQHQLRTLGMSARCLLHPGKRTSTVFDVCFVPICDSCTAAKRLTRSRHRQRDCPMIPTRRGRGPALRLRPEGVPSSGTNQPRSTRFAHRHNMIEMRRREQPFNDFHAPSDCPCREPCNFSWHMQHEQLAYIYQ